MMGDGGTHGAGAGAAGVASVAEVPPGAPGAGTLGGVGGVLMVMVMLEAKDAESDESGSSAVQTSAMELCSDKSASEKGELSFESLGALGRGGVSSEILQVVHLEDEDRSV